MNTESTWKPLIQKSDEPLYVAIVKALANDITAGRLNKDYRLPTQRELAETMKIALGTVTRAYAEAERRGIIRSEGRRGTFVGQARHGRGALASLASGGAESIDMSANHPTHELDPDLAAALRVLARKAGTQKFLCYPPPEGLPHHRAAGAAWISSMGLKTAPDSVIVTSGAQHALQVAFAAFAEPGCTVATEQLTYPGVMAAAETLGLHVAGIASDDEGPLPESLEQLCRGRKVRILYQNPTHHNPTNVTTSAVRRKEIASLATKHDILILEDDIFRPFCTDPGPFLASLAPERTILIISTSKTIAAGLRVGFMAAPEKLRLRLLEKLQVSILGVAPLPTEVIAMWLTDGTAERVVAERKAEMEKRQKLAGSILKPWNPRLTRYGCQVWLPLPENWASMEFAGEAQRRGVAIAPADIFAVGRKSAVNAARLTLSTVADREILKRALEILAGILAGRPRRERLTV